MQGSESDPFSGLLHLNCTQQSTKAKNQSNLAKPMEWWSNYNQQSSQKKEALTVEGKVESGVESPCARRQGEGQTGDARETLASEGHQGLGVAGDAHHVHQVSVGQEVQAGELRAVAFQELLHVFQNLLLKRDSNTESLDFHSCSTAQGHTAMTLKGENQCRN